MGRRKKQPRSIISTILWAPVQIVVLTGIGYLLPFFLFVSPLFGFSYFVMKARIDERRATGEAKIQTEELIALARGVVVGIVFAAALIAPFRGWTFLVTKLGGNELMNEFFAGLSVNGFSDAWLGLIGVVFPILAGFTAWNQGLRLKSQIINIPTSTARAAALGLSEFKGVARAIPNDQHRMTKVVVDGDEKQAVPKRIKDTDSESAILYHRYDKRPKSRFTEIRSRFYLEDDSGQILVDPRQVEFWDGMGHFFWRPVRSVYLEKRFKESARSEVRQLNSGDEIYLIGAVEENEDADPNAIGSRRLIVRPSSTLKSTDLLRRILLGKPKRTQGADIYDVFFLSDVKEVNAAAVLSQGMGKNWIWVGVWVCLSIPLLAEYWDKLLDWRSLVKVISTVVGL